MLRGQAVGIEAEFLIQSERHVLVKTVKKQPQTNTF